MPMTRRASTVLSVAGLLCACLLSACSDRPAADGVVPWTDEPAQGALLAQSTTAPRCQVSALSLPRGEQAWGGVWHDAVSGYFTIRNSGRAGCQLAAPARVTAATREGPKDLAIGPLADRTVVLAPGDEVQVQVSSPYDCGKPLLESTGLVVALATGRLHVRHARMAVQCGGGLADFSARDTSTVATTPAAGLQARLSRVPGSVGPGSTVSYTVTLTNPASRRVTLEQCPSYEEGIKGQPSSVHRYQLNCDGAPAIGPHRSVTFAMQLPLPDHADAGAAVLDWHLQVPGPVSAAQFASARVNIR